MDERLPGGEGGDEGGARVALLVDASTSSPVPLNMLYLAANLSSNGYEPLFLPLPSAAEPGEVERLRTVLQRSRPAALGISLYTDTALCIYRLLEALGDLPCVKVAGGPHASVLPDEALSRGFDVVVRGEAENTLVELIAALMAGSSLDAIRGVSFRAPSGKLHHNPACPPVDDLDSLPSPTIALPRLMAALALEPQGLTPTLTTSRGCPARCTFCMRGVHGRRFRTHHNERVQDELLDWRRITKSPLAVFCDASFLADRRRALSLCEHLQRLEPRPVWWCEARADQIDDDIALAMKRAGCGTLMIGAESGHPGRLQRIGKGMGPDVIREALETARRCGLGTQVSFMFGFPDEQVDELRTTLGFMQSIAPSVGLFSPMGILQPYPATELYEHYHASHGFTDWWLDTKRSTTLESLGRSLTPQKTVDDLISMHAEVERTFLDHHPIALTPPVREAIEQCLQFRREHNRKRLCGDRT